MNRYIYPAGITGHYLAWIMRFLYRDVEITFIDDSEATTNLESFARKNPNKDIVVELALSRLSDNYENKLTNMKRNLERLGIVYRDKSLEWHIQKVNEKVKKEFIGNEKVVVMLCQRTGGNKHFGFLREELLKRGVKVILVCSDIWVYEALREYNSEKCLVIYWLAAYMNYLNFGEVVLETSHFEFDSPNKNLILIGHSFCNNTSYIHNYQQISATCVFDKRHIKESREEYIPSGYLGFDVMLDKINSTAGGGANSVLIAPYDIEELRLFARIIQKILKKYKVILRQRFEWLEASEYPKYIEILKTFCGDLCIDAGESFLVSSYKESFCLICGKTTTKSTYPLLTKKPVVVLPHKRPEKWVGLEIDTIARINLSSYEEAENNILEILEGIQVNREFWSAKIQQYRDENVYNFGRASQWLADYLVAKYHL